MRSRNLVLIFYANVLMTGSGHAERHSLVLVRAGALDAALPRGLVGVGEPLRVGADAVELVAPDGGVVERDEDEVLVGVVLEAVRDAPLERLLLELARVGHRGVHQLDALLGDAARVSLGEKFLQFWGKETKFRIFLCCPNKPIQRLGELEPSSTQPLTTFIWTADF